MKTGFELIQAREISYQNKITAMEKKNGVTLPPLYKLCASYFELGSYKSEKYIIKSNEFKDSLIIPKYNGNEYIEWDFFSIENVFEHYSSLLGYGDEDMEMGLLRIAPISFGGSIFVGIRENNMDKVILSLWDKFPVYETLADNIFEFIHNFKVLKTPEDELIDAKYSQLYKNWGEDFWRVREE
jgi:hypothetical protein